MQGKTILSDIDSKTASEVPPSKKGVARLVAATKYSAAGLKAAFKSEEAFRLEVYVFIILAPLGLWLGDGGVEKLLLVGSVVQLMIVELLNTAIEVVINRISPEFHPLSGRAKDIGSACVLISIGMVVLTWSLVLL